jgi:hypothetical protein
MHSSAGFLRLGVFRGRRKTRRRDPDDSIFRADGLDSAGIAFEALTIADFQSKGAVARRRLAGFYAFAASVAQGLVDRILIIIVVRILFVDLADHLPLDRVPRTDFPRRKPHFIGLARYIIIGRA